MFMGEYRHTIDAKGRLIVPAKFREQLGDSFVVTRGMDGCLFGYTQEEWNMLETKLQKLPLTKKDARAFVRFFYSAATECEIDKQGRINSSYHYENSYDEMGNLTQTKRQAAGSDIVVEYNYIYGYIYTPNAA